MGRRDWLVGDVLVAQHRGPEFETWNSPKKAGVGGGWGAVRLKSQYWRSGNRQILQTYWLASLAELT